MDGTLSSKLNSKIVNSLLNVGLKKNGVKTKTGYTMSSYQQSFIGKIALHSFHILVSARELYDYETLVVKNRKWKWSIKININVENSQNVRLSLRPEPKKIINEIQKLLGRQDLEVYDEIFDSAFIIQSNHKYAYVKILDAKIREQMMSVHDGFTKINLENKKIVYTEKISLKYDDDDMIQRLCQLIKVSFLIAKKIDSF